MKVIIKHLLTGAVQPYGGNGRCSAIDKHFVDGPLWLDIEGFHGDEQADRRHHGGPEKAVHHYAFEHYPAWQRELPHSSRWQQPGAFGENLVTTPGMTEDSVCVGDIYQLGGAVVQVSQARQPCWKLNLRFDERRMARLVQSSGRTGWYYRVLEPGEVSAGQTVELLTRPQASWTLSRLLRALYVDTLNYAELQAISELAELTESWRQLALKRCAQQQVEDWGRRVEVPE